MHDAPKPVAQCQSIPLLGHLPKHPIRPAWAFGHCAVLSQRKRRRGSGISLDVSDDRAELWLLHTSRAVGGYLSYDRDADDSKDLRLCVDGTHWIFRYETRMQIRRIHL